MTETPPAPPEVHPEALEDETLCIYCQREYDSPGRLRTHVLRMHPGTYRASAYLQLALPAPSTVPVWTFRCLRCGWDAPVRMSEAEADRDAETHEHGTVPRMFHIR